MVAIVQPRRFNLLHFEPELVVGSLKVHSV
jgi:hypothetical protein